MAPVAKVLLSCGAVAVFYAMDLYAVEMCGGYTSQRNPNLCCTEDYDKDPTTSLSDDQQGNCVWWAWYKANGYYGVETYSRSAKHWSTLAKSDGYAVGYSPIANTIAVREAGAYGHVAWVEAVSGSNIDVSEMNCKYSSSALGTTARQHSYGSGFFSRYILPSLKAKKIEIQDEQTVRADASATSSSPNFYAVFSVENPTSKDVVAEEIVLSLQKLNNQGWVDQYDMRDECSGSGFKKTEVRLSSRSVSDEYKVTANIVTTGTYRVVPRAKVSGRWFEIGEGVTFEVEDTAEFSGQGRYRCSLGTVMFDGEMGCVGYGANTIFNDLAADLSSSQGVYTFSGRSNTKNKATDSNYSATAYINGVYNPSNQAVSFDIKKVTISTRQHYRTDRCSGTWSGSGLYVPQCMLTYDNGAGCTVWLKMRLSQ